jgi:hypothetical protein
MDTNYLLAVNNILIEIKNYLDEFGNLNIRMILQAKRDDLISIIHRLETHEYEPVRLDSGTILTKEGLLIDARTNLDRINNILVSGGKRKCSKRKCSKRKCSKRKYTNKRKKRYINKRG